MKLIYFFIISLFVGGLVVVVIFVMSVGVENGFGLIVVNENFEMVIFVGGCFWCVESDFDKLDGVVEIVFGYIGGNLINLIYKIYIK